MSKRLNEFLQSFDQNLNDKKEEYDNSFNIKEKNEDSKPKLNAAGRPIKRTKISDISEGEKHGTDKVNNILDSENGGQDKRPNKIKLNRKINLNKPKTDKSESSQIEKINKAKYEIQKDIEREERIELEKQNEEKIKRVIDSAEQIDNMEISSNDLLDLFEKSGTPIYLKDKWYDLYRKALESNKQTLTNSKIRRGKFRFTKEGQLEILPDHETSGKTAVELLHEQWKIN